MNEVILTPESLLLATNLTASAKLVWMLFRLQSSPDLASTTWLCTASGLSRPTVLAALAQLQKSGWTPTLPAPHGLAAQVPGALLLDQRLSAQARVLYGQLLVTPGFRHPCGQFTYPALTARLRAGPHTIRRAVGALVRAEWIKLERANRLAPTHFELTFPGFERSQNMLAAAQRRLEKAQFYGEGLMREYLSLLIDSDHYEDDAAPGFLVNPRTQERLQLDRFYPPSVAFEFNGPQHYRATARFSANHAAAQRERDLIKLGICVTRGITLVVIHPAELTLKGMQAAVGSLLPRRDLVGCDLLIDFLESEGRAYRRALERI